MKVSIVSIPIKHHDPVIEFKDFSLRYHANGYGLYLGYRHFHPGYLTKTIKNITGKIIDRFGDAIELNVDELTYPESKREEYSLMQYELDTLVDRIRQYEAGSDLVVLLGGDHTGGYLLYNMYGKVLRFDAHSDRDSYYDGSYPSVDCACYVSAAVSKGLKADEDVYEYEPDPLQRPSGLNGGIIDVDIDAFPLSLNMIDEKRYFSYGNTSREELYDCVRKYSPHALGFFEYYPEDDIDGNGVDMIVESISIMIDQKTG